MQVIAEALPLMPLVEVIGLKCLKLKDLLKKKKKSELVLIYLKKEKTRKNPKQKYIFVGFILWKDKVRRRYNKTFLF